jgi:two-component system, OmpR family, sensor histidine kinase QseC
MNAFRPDNSAPRGWSLRNRLMGLLVVATSGLWGLASWSIYQDAKLQSVELFDESLAETAALLLAVIEHEMAEHGIDYAGQLIDAAEVPGTRYLRFQVWDSQYNLIYRSPDAPATPLVAMDAAGYGVGMQGDEALRTYAAWNAKRSLMVQMADPDSHRNDVTRDVVTDLIMFAAVFLPITLFLIWWIVSRSFGPVRWVSEEVTVRTGQQLHDVSMENVPREIAPLIHAINSLLARIRDTLAAERRFTADAAHELRTPLAAVRAHAQVLQGARTSQEAQEAAGDIIVGVDRSRRLVDQLLALARVDQAVHGVAASQPIELSSLVRQQVTDHQSLAGRHGIHLYQQLAPASISGYVDQLHILLRNLIDNALRYTPSGGEVRVSCGTDARGAFLAVHDSGHGIPESERRRIFERFYRINRVETSHTFGSGLGLSIVQRLAEKHAARIEIEDGLNGRGVGFVVRFDAGGQVDESRG